MARQRTEESKRAGRFIAELRERHHLTQEEAAKQLKVGHRTYQAWESGESVPRWANRVKLAKLYHVKPIDILGPPTMGSTLDPAALARIEAKLDRLLARQAEPSSDVEDGHRLIDEMEDELGEDDDADQADEGP